MLTQTAVLEERQGLWSAVAAESHISTSAGNHRPISTRVGQQAYMEYFDRYAYPRTSAQLLFP